MIDTKAAATSEELIRDSMREVARWVERRREIERPVTTALAVVIWTQFAVLAIGIASAVILWGDPGFTLSHGFRVVLVVAILCVCPVATIAAVVRLVDACDEAIRPRMEPFPEDASEAEGDPQS